jgi:hypothetical protein
VIDDPANPVADAIRAANLMAESLVAMTGIFPTREPSEIEIRGAKNYTSRIRRRLARFLESTEVEPIKWHRPPSQDSLWESIVTPVDPQEFTAWGISADLDVAVAVAYPAIIQAARDHIKTLWPLWQDTSLGLRTHELSTDEYFDVWHIVRTLNAPEAALDDLDSMLLLPEQMAAIKAVFPTLYESTRALTMAQLRPYIEVQGTVEKRKDLPAERESQIRVLLGITEEDTFEVVKEEPKQQPASTPSDTERRETKEEARTPSEKAAAK